MNILSPLPRFTTLVSPVTSCTPALCAASRMDSTTRRSSSAGQAFFQNECRRQIERARSTHGQIVHCAVDGQASDVAAGKEDRRDHERIGGESQAGTVDLQDRLIIELIQHGIGESRQEYFLDQLSAELAATAVAKHDLLVLKNRQRTRTEDRRNRSFAHCESSFASLA